MGFDIEAGLGLFGASKKKSASTNLTIVGVVDDSGDDPATGLVLHITMSGPVAGLSLPAGWLHDYDADTLVVTTVVQSTHTLLVTMNGESDSGDGWELISPTPGVVFPQTGIIRAD